MDNSSFRFSDKVQFIVGVLDGLADQVRIRSLEHLKALNIDEVNRNLLRFTIENHWFNNRMMALETACRIEHEEYQADADEFDDEGVFVVGDRRN